MTFRRIPALTIALTLVAASGCGGDDDGSSSRAAAATPAPSAAQADRAPAGTPVTTQKAAAITLGTPQARVEQQLGDALPVEDYALTAKERRTCRYHPIETSYGEVDYDNVLRFCFKDGKLYTFSTAPSREAASPDAGAEGSGKAGGALTKPAD